MRPLFFIFAYAVLISASVKELYAQTLFRNGPNSALYDSHSILSIANPSEIIHIKNYAVGFSVEPARYGMSELNFAELNLIKSFSENISGAVTTSGIYNDLFYQVNSRISLAYKFDKILTIGAALETDFLGVKNFSNDYKIFPIMGAVIRFNDEFKAGLYITNLSRSKFKRGDNSISQEAVFSLGYNLTENFLIDASTILNLNYSSGVAFNFNYKFNDAFSIFLGYLNNPAVVKLGVSLSASPGIGINYEGEYNNALGYSNAVQCLLHYK